MSDNKTLQTDEAPASVCKRIVRPGMRRVFKPLDVNGLRLYKVQYSFIKNPNWNKFVVVAAKSPTHAVELIETLEAETNWIEKPYFSGYPIQIYQPEKWWKGEDEHFLFESEKDEKRQIVANQLKQVNQKEDIICRCGHRSPFQFMYRCYYCGEFYCNKCAEEHFA